jgi:hypothetical protein
MFMPSYIILILVLAALFFAYLARETPLRWAEWMWSGFTILTALAAFSELAALCR